MSRTACSSVLNGARSSAARRATKPVQSVALRLVCAREAEIEAFVAQEYWTVEAAVATAAGARFAAGLDRLDGAPADGRGLAARETAEAAARRIREGAFAAVSVERRTVRRRPAPPFTTAALQQEAARRFGFGVGYTMRIAQALYEGIDLEGGRAGLITYMRTDGVAAAKAAVDEARRTVRRENGDEYLSRAPRAFRSRAVNVHEAHEAIRPTEVARTPESLAGAVTPDAVRLAETPVEVAHGIVQAFLDLVLDVPLDPVGVVRSELRHEVVGVRDGRDAVADAELARARLAVDDAHLGLVEIDMLPPQGEDFVPPAAGQHQQADGRHRGGGYPAALARDLVQHLPEAGELGVGQEPLPFALGVRRDGLAGIVAVLGRHLPVAGERVHVAQGRDNHVRHRGGRGAAPWRVDRPSSAGLE